MQVAVDDAAKSPTRSMAIGWREKFERETKVNQELGRRLREAKQQLVDEKALVEELRALLGNRAAPLQQSEPTVDDKDAFDATPEAEDASQRTAGQPTSSVPTFVPESRAPTRRHSVALELSSLELPSRPLAVAEEPQVRRHYRHRLSLHDDSNQVYHEQSFLAFLGRQEPSPSPLDALFKYAFVLAGPPPAKPRRNLLTAISERLRGTDFRRTRSMPEGQPPSTELTSFAIESPTPTKARAQAGGSWLTRVRSPPTDAAVEEPSPSVLSPQKRPGWFSNLMANGLRGGSGSSTPLSPGGSSLGRPEPSLKTSPTTSKMLAVFPPGTEATGVPELEGLVEICFPYGDKQPRARDFSLPQLKRTLQERHRTFRSSDATFVLTLASADAARPADLTYAICVRCPLFPDEEDQLSLACDDDQGQGSASAGPLPSQCCICLLTPFPFFNLFFKVLYGIAVLWDVKRREHLERGLSRASTGSLTDTDDDAADASLVRPLGLQDFAAHFHEVMQRLQGMRFPPVGGWSRMELSPGMTPLSFHRPHSESAAQERRALLLEYAAPVLFGLLSVDQVLFLLGCLCCERKVLLVSDHVHAVSACVLALTTLLSPLQWAGPVVTVLPPRLEELLEAPVPLIAGRVSTPAGSSASCVPMRGVIEMDMDRNDLRMHEEDMMAFHELKLPDCDELVHELSRPAELLFQRHGEPDFPSAQQAEACERVCDRIRSYLESLCALAVSDQAAEEAAGDSGRCGTLVAAFVAQLRQTQMFSEFRLLHEAERGEEDDGGEGDDDDDGSDTNIDDWKEAEGDQALEQALEPESRRHEAQEELSDYV